MRSAAVALLALRAACAWATGANEIEYLGVTARGEPVRLEYKAEPNVYRSARVARLSHCLAEDRRITCKPGATEPARVLYELGKPATSDARIARRIYLRDAAARGSYLGRFLVCRAGCVASVPRILIEIGRAD